MAYKGKYNHLKQPVSHRENNSSLQIKQQATRTLWLNKLQLCYSSIWQLSYFAVFCIGKVFRSVIYNNINAEICN